MGLAGRQFTGAVAPLRGALPFAAPVLTVVAFPASAQATFPGANGQPRSAHLGPAP